MKNNNKMHSLFLSWYEENKLLFKEKCSVKDGFFEDSMGNFYECFIENQNRIIDILVFGEESGGGMISYFGGTDIVKEVTLDLDNLITELDNAKAFILNKDDKNIL